MYGVAPLERVRTCCLRSAVDRMKNPRQKEKNIPESVRHEETRCTVDSRCQSLQHLKQIYAIVIVILGASNLGQINHVHALGSSTNHEVISSVTMCYIIRSRLVIN